MTRYRRYDGPPTQITVLQTRQSMTGIPKPQPLLEFAFSRISHYATRVQRSHHVSCAT